MIDLFWLQGSIGKMKRTVVREVVWKHPWSVQRGIDGNDSVAGGEMIHGRCQCVDMPLIHNRKGRTFVGTPKEKSENIFWYFWIDAVGSGVLFSSSL